MAVERAVDHGGGVEVRTTGADVSLRPGGELVVTARIPQPREVLRVRTPPGAWTLCGHGEGEARAESDALHAVVLESSMIILRARKGVRLHVVSSLEPELLTHRRGARMVFDASGGFGVYPMARGRTRLQRGSGPLTVEVPVAAGEEVWLSVFPPRRASAPCTFHSVV